MKTIGNTLKEARVKKKLTINQVSNKTKIQSNYIKALENDDYSTLPASAFVKGFIKNYARAVGVKQKAALAVFRRDFAQGPEGKIVPRSLIKPIEKPSPFTPKITAIIIFASIATLIIAILARQIYFFYSGPPITISMPENQAIVNSPLTVSGNTSPDSTLTINNNPVTVDSNGDFNTQITISPGDHTLVITATNRKEKSRTAQIFITVEE